VQTKNQSDAALHLQTQHYDTMTNDLLRLQSKLALMANLNGRQHKGVVAHSTRKSEITQLDNSTLAEQDVLWLHVSVQNASSMKIIQRRHQLCCY